MDRAAAAVLMLNQACTILTWKAKMKSQISTPPPQLLGNLAERKVYLWDPTQNSRAQTACTVSAHKARHLCLGWKQNSSSKNLMDHMGFQKESLKTPSDTTSESSANRTKITAAFPSLHVKEWGNSSIVWSWFCHIMDLQDQSTLI